MRASPCMKGVLAVALSLAGCGRFGFSLSGASSERDDAGGAFDGANGSGADGASAVDADAGGPLADAGGASNSGSGGNADAGSGGIGGGTSGGSSGGTSGGSPACSLDVNSLAHRYAFNEAGAMVLDSAGAAHGRVRGASLDGSGALTLDGSGDYVMLPAGLISGKSRVTIMMWVEWDSGPQHQVLFDVGATQEGAGISGTPTSHVQLKVSTPQSGLTVTTHTASVNTSWSVTQVLRIATVEQVAVVINVDRGTITLYRDGSLLSERPVQGISLAQVNDVDFWLGGTLDSADADFRGRLLEARIYNAALYPCHVQQLSDNGPDDPTLLPCGCP